VRLGKAHFALVPIENSVEGVVARTLDELATGEPLTIVGEVTLPVSFALMIKGDEKEILRIATHPHAEAQCRNYVATHYPDAELISTASTAAAAEAISRGEFDAAIAAPVAALTMVFASLQTTLATMQERSHALFWFQNQARSQRTQDGIALLWQSLLA
jgi:prephenate dehydratase